MGEFALVWAALRYRKGQAAALAVLAALVTACAVFAPLYDRVMLQSLVDVRLAHTTPLLSGVQLEAAQREAARWSTEKPAVPPEPTELLDRVPPGARASYGPPVLGWTDTLTHRVGTEVSVGQLMWRTAACEHVEIVDGRCPRAAGEILVSAADADYFHLAVGRRVQASELSPGTEAPPGRHLTVVGAYSDPDASWFVQDLTGFSGTTTEDVPVMKRHEAWLTVEQTFTSGRRLPVATSYVGLRLRPERVGVDELLRLGDQLSALRTSLARSTSGPRVQLTTGLTDTAADVRSQQHDAHVIVPLLMAQLGLLCLVVLWLALVAVTDLRRNEVAVARLRGRGVRGGGRLVLTELLPAVGLGLVPGVAAAWAGGALAARLLPGDAGVELRLPVLLAVAAVIAVLVLTILLAASRVGRMPVDALLRRSSSARRGWRVGAVDAVLVVACGVVVVLFVGGGLDGPVALVAPSIVALFTGLLLAHLLTPLTAAWGRLLLRRGRARTAVALLEAGRSPALRSTVTVLTVAAALAVFSVDAVVVADRNRTAAAEQEAGAPVVALVASHDLTAVEEAVGDRPGVMPVVRIQGTKTVPTLAVRPADFRRIALLPGDLADDLARTKAWAALEAGAVAPVAFTGTALSVTATAPGLSEPGEGAVTLGADLASGSSRSHTELGPVPREGSRRLTAPVSCDDGCDLVGLTLSTTGGSRVTGSVTVQDVRSDGAPVALGDAWSPGPDDRATPHRIADGLTLAVDTRGEERVSVSQGWLPEEVPALVTAPAATPDLVLTGFNGRPQAGRAAAVVPRIPGAPDRAALVDLDVFRRAASSGSDLQVELWAKDTAALGPVVDALEHDGIGVVSTTRLAEIRQRYDQSAPAWSVSLGLVVGLAAIGVALILLTVLAVSGWRRTARDLSTLWLGGVRRRDVHRLGWTAQLPAVVLGVLAGGACGLVGAAMSMPIVPLFAEAPGVDTLDLGTPWVPVTVVAAAVLAVVAACSTGIGWTVARRASLERVRETA
ncbi:FtsX-like permease family protein [Nocardioides sp. CER19]|uniref:FtsX-like permease family protein n=1 Tax=Nocardioides sp. CER19 TaxID=3038538 RepID=UPI00244904A7|nr:FtsX-like permease family protein [Nocardioides sp. CER19]MDH2414912.1 hypothetical protein [Nocardioides sp. CER19]